MPCVSLYARQLPRSSLSGGTSDLVGSHLHPISFEYLVDVLATFVFGAERKPNEIAVFFLEALVGKMRMNEGYTTTNVSDSQRRHDVCS